MLICDRNCFYFMWYVVLSFVVLWCCWKQCVQIFLFVKAWSNIVKLFWIVKFHLMYTLAWWKWNFSKASIWKVLERAKDWAKFQVCDYDIKFVIKHKAKVLVSCFSRYLLEFETSTLHKTYFIKFSAITCLFVNHLELAKMWGNFIVYYMQETDNVLF